MGNEQGQVSRLMQQLLLMVLLPGLSKMPWEKHRRRL
jgi:hypothetical protein